MNDSSTRRFGAVISFLGGLCLPLALFLAMMCIGTLSRLLLVVWSWSRFDSSSQVLHTFLVGLRTDMVTSAYPAGLLALSTGLLPARLLRRLRIPVCAYCVFWICAFTCIEACTPSFMAEFDTRPNRLMIEPLFHPREILTTVVKLHYLALLGIVVLLVVVGRFVALACSRFLKDVEVPGPAGRAARLTVLLPFIVLGARGSLGHRPYNVSSASFSTNKWANELALNSLFSFGSAVYALRHEEDPAALYGSMPRDEIIRRVRKYLAADGSWGFDKDIPFCRNPGGEVAVHDPPLNIVVFLQESLGAEFVGCLGGLPLTPNIDRLSKEGLLFTRFFSTGTRTVRGIEAVIAGFPPGPGRSIVKLGNTQRGCFTVAELLRRRGYETIFVYGGEANFDNMKHFFLGNGFTRIVEGDQFVNRTYEGTWGLCDEDLMEEADRIFAEQKGPFFSLVLSTSNHTPYEFPAGRIELYEQPPNTRNNAVKFADYSIGHFFELARKREYYKNTIFVIVADHDTRVYGHAFVPVSKFHIPCLILGPGVPVMRYDKTASQLDIMPTVLPLAGIADRHPMLGRNVLALPTSDPGRAVMQYYRFNALMVGDKVLMTMPHSKSRFFSFDGKDLTEETGVPDELSRDGLAHALSVGLLLNEKAHRLP